MATLMQLANRVALMEGHKNTEDTTLMRGIYDDINECYDELHTKQPWYWCEETETVTASSNVLLIPSDAAFILGVFDSNGKVLEPRSRKRQKEHASEISSTGLKTYALDGYDSTNDQDKLYLSPDQTGDFDIWHTSLPARMSNDTDEPVGSDKISRAIGDFLVWRARWLRLHEDEERNTLFVQAFNRSQQHLARLQTMNARFLESLPEYFTLPRV